MKTRRVTRYNCDCGRGFWSKQSCQAHEEKCKSWKNPKFKTCKTCKYGKLITDSNGMEHEPQNLDTWSEWHCDNIEFDYDKHFKPAHENAPDLCINCELWEIKEK